MMSRTATAFERISSTVLTLAALSLAAVFVHREFFPQETQRPRRIEYVKDWKTFVPHGRSTTTLADSTKSTIVVLEFADFECPFCRQFAAALAEASKGYNVQHTFVHFPLPTHKFAKLTAQMAECSAPAGKFWAMHDLLFARQDSFGLKPWGEYAATLGLDAVKFRTCLADPATMRKLDEGRRAGMDIGLRATPTVLVDGYRFPTPPDVDALKRAFSLLQAGKTPLSGG